MIDKELIYNNEYIVILPWIETNLKESFEHTFNNVYVLDDRYSLKKHIDIINNGNYKQIIFVDFLSQYMDIIKYYNEEKKYKVIFTKSLGSLSSENNYLLFNSCMNLLKDFSIEKIGFLDINLYNAFKNKIKCFHVSLDIKEEKQTEYDKKKIGILNNENNSMHSFYNELSALSFNNYKAVLTSVNKTTKDFLKLFNIKHVKSKNNVKGNLVNLYINFTDSDNTVFFRSMDLGVPCIIGNNELLKGSNLDKFLVVESDDSIDEISQKIELVSKNRNQILKEYENFRKDYSSKVKKEMEDFLDYKIVEEKEKEYEKLLSIVVPVYNVEQYLDSCLKSIIKSIPNRIKNKCEILIINDGSTDNSESIINSYKEKYSDLIVYIKQDNGGLGQVRNVALKNVRGKYIASIDSDDTVNKEFFKEVLKAINKNVDVFICDWLIKIDNSKYHTPAIESSIFDNISKYEAIMYSSIMPSTCNKVFKKELFDKLDINYLEDKFEDLSTNPFVLMIAKTIKYVNKPYYEYYARSSSIMRSPVGFSMINVLKEFNKRLNKYKSNCTIDLDKFKYYTISWRIEEFIFNLLYDASKKEKDEIIKHMYNDLYDVIVEIFNNKYYIEMVNGLKKENKEFIQKRNEAFINKKLTTFKMDSNSFRLNGLIIYYGDKELTTEKKKKK